MKEIITTKELKRKGKKGHFDKSVSIIIVNWNGLKWIEKCLDSLRVQTYKNYEIIFVDNASSDSSVEFVKKNYPEIKIVRSEKNLGFAGGNNLGIKNSSGDYIFFLNNDTWVEEDFLEKIVNYYASNSYDVIAPREGRYSGEKQIKAYSTIDLFGHPTYFFKRARPFFYLSGVSLFFKKKLNEETGGLDNDFFMYFEEIDWFWRLNLLGNKLCQSDDIFVYHGKGGSTGSGIKYNSFLWRNQNTLQMLLKNYKWFTLFWVLPVYFIQNIFEIIFFIIILKPEIAYTYIEGWIFNIKNIGKILEKRKWVQKNRKVGDFEIMKKMYKGPGKLIHLNKYFLNK